MSSLLVVLLIAWFLTASALVLWFEAASREYARAYRIMRGVNMPLGERGQRMQILFECQHNQHLEGLRRRARRRLTFLISVMFIISIPLVVARVLTG